MLGFHPNVNEVVTKGEFHVIPFGKGGLRKSY